MDSLKLGDEVHVISTKGICLEPVITFIHYHPEVMQEFLKITTKKNKVLKITEDHLIFVEKKGQAAAIPARDVNVGDTVYVKEKHGVEKDAVQSTSTVYEKGVYAPVTLGGTILVNDVHTSCYFDVLSHEWSHRAMGVARAVHYVSPWMLQRISGVGQKDGFQGWCRLVHKMLTLLD
ncbi:tiggy-winkle hedgehog protein-like [Oculina patagonica]